MFTPHVGICSCGCRSKGWIVVKAGYIKGCNERIKKAKKNKSPIKKVKTFSGSIDVRSLTIKFDNVFSLYVRTKHADENGMVKCFTCPTTLPIKAIQNGHFISRRHFILRWDERNCRPQCPTCNGPGDGMVKVFERELEKETPGVVAKLTQLKRGEMKLSIYGLKKQIVTYSNLLIKLKQKP